MAKQNLGMVTAYAYAVVGGYEGTEAEFEALLGNIATDLAEIENLTVIANTLPPGSQATASYDHGVLTLGIPKGDKGDTGAGATVTAGTTTTGNPGTNASVTNSGTTKDAVFNFTIPRGDTGNGIESIYLTGTSGAVKTYTILFTDGNTTTFDVTDGEVTNATLAAILTEYATEEEVSPIMEHIISPNRFDKDGDLKNGYYLDSHGALIQYGTWITSDYCYVGDLTQAYTTADTDNHQGRKLITPYYICTYDKDKNFIEQIGAMPTNPVALNSNVEFVRFCIQASETQVQLGNMTAQESYNGFYDYYGVKKSALKSFKDSIDFTPVTLSLTSKKLVFGLTGAVGDTASDTYVVSDPVAVTPFSKVMVSSAMNYGQALYAFYDSDGAVVQIRRSSELQGATEKIYCDIIEVPVGAASIRVGYVGTASPFLWIGAPQGTYHTGIWSGKKWCCLGDSLTEYNSRTSMHYFDFIRADKGIQVYNMGMSGTGYGREQGNGNAFYQRAANIPVDSDVITVFGSFNDMGAGLPVGTYTDSGTTTLAGCINATIDAIQTRIPLANIGIVSPTPWLTSQPDESGTAYDYVAVMERICKHRSIPFLDLWRCSNLRPWDADFRAIAYSKDDGNGVHPDENGHKLIAPHFKALLESLII